MPRASFTSWEWQEDGLCRKRDENLFIGPDSERAAARRRRELRAVQICQVCPVLARCRRHALDEREPHGVWGGLTEQARLRLREDQDPQGTDEPDA